MVHGENSTTETTLFVPGFPQRLHGIRKSCNGDLTVEYWIFDAINQHVYFACNTFIDL